MAFQIFYHGYISRDHLHELLQDKGDFLVRRTEVETKSGKWAYVVSINTGAEGPNKVWPLPPSSSIAALIEHYPFQIRHCVLLKDPTDKKMVGL